MGERRTHLDGTPYNATPRTSLLAISMLLLAASFDVKATNAPAHFQPHATTEVGNGLSCVAGATTKDGKGWDERAYVYLEDSASHKVRWSTPIPVHQGWYQNRATHCVGYGDRVYALVQSDTNAVPVLSQTLISVVTLNMTSGQVEASDVVKVPDRKGAHTVYVSEGAQNFHLDDGKIVITGEWSTKGDASDTRTPFKTDVPLEHPH